MNRWCVVLLFAGCFSFAQTPPELRLPDQVRPTKYALDLRLIPEEDTYGGTIAIDVQVRQATPTIWLNATGLKLNEASVQARGKRMLARVVSGGREFAGLQLDEPVAAGTARIEIAFSGVLNKTDVEGLFKQTENGSSYILTQFEPTSARRAFPCFDEPTYKVPWRLTVHSRKDLVVSANTPVISETEEPGGMKSVRFAESKPLPSYLVAIAVGPFDIVDGGKAGRNKTPLRILAAKGRGGDTSFATEVTPKIVEKLEAYFGVPYPFEKLDQATIPVTVAFGAMENAGLITYQQSLLVARKQDDTIESRRATAEVIAHELAHQWFGNMVTPAWWDDIWLNEAFATWMEKKIITELFPEWNVGAGAINSKYDAIAKDTLLAARKIRQPIEGVGDIGNAFDSITYQKGGAVIGMFEHYLGEDKFRRGVQAYMKKHAWGNATATDFLASISGAAGRNIAPAFETFLNRGGVPLLTVDLRCEKGAAPKVTVQQERLLPAGSTGSRQTYWQLPVCVEYASGGKVGRECALLGDPKDEITLKGNACPAWINANSDAAGYYQVAYGGGLLQKLTANAASMTLFEKVELLRNAASLVSTGQMRADEALALLPAFEKSPEQEVVGATVQIVAAVRRDVPQPLLPKFAAFVRNLYGERARQIGFQPKPGESRNTRLLRVKLIGAAGLYGDDPVLVEQAKALAAAWLKNANAVDPDMADTVLWIAASHGDEAFFRVLADEAKKSPDRRRRTRIFTAIGKFRDPAIARQGLELMLSTDFDVRETMKLLTAYVGEPSTATVAWDFLKAHYEELLPRLPSRLGTHAGSDLPSAGKGFCSEGGRQELADFFRERIKTVFGGERTLAETLEYIQLCGERRTPQQQASIRQFLNQY